MSFLVSPSLAGAPMHAGLLQQLLIEKVAFNIVLCRGGALDHRVGRIAWVDNAEEVAKRRHTSCIIRVPSLRQPLRSGEAMRGPSNARLLPHECQPSTGAEDSEDEQAHRSFWEVSLRVLAVRYAWCRFGPAMHPALVLSCCGKNQAW
jgi:hypothetical protein